MADEKEERLEELAKLLFELFVNRSDDYALQTEQGTYVRANSEAGRRLRARLGLPEQLTPELIKKHLRGEITLGVYPYDPETGLAKWGCFDLDDATPELVRRIYEVIKEDPVLKNACLVERSSTPDRVHIWVFFDGEEPGVIRWLMKRIAEKAGVDPRAIEIFPKQSDVSAEFGNLIRLPLGLHRRKKLWSAFINPETGEELDPLEALKSAWPARLAEEARRKIKAEIEEAGKPREELVGREAEESWRPPEGLDLDFIEERILKGPAELIFCPALTKAITEKWKPGHRRPILTLIHATLRGLGFSDRERVRRILAKINERFDPPLTGGEFEPWFESEWRRFGRDYGPPGCAIVRGEKEGGALFAGLGGLKLCEGCPAPKWIEHPILYTVWRIEELRREQIRSVVSELEKREAKKRVLVPDYDLPYDPDVLLQKCRALRAIAEKAREQGRLDFEERKIVFLTLMFLGEPGRKKIHEVLGPCEESEYDRIDRRIKRFMKGGFFPISCAKIRSRTGLCGDCPGAATPIEYAFGEDPNRTVVLDLRLHELDASLLDRFVGVDVLVAGIADTFSVPYLIFASCAFTERDRCKDCPFYKGELLTIDDLRIELNPAVDLYIDLTRRSDAEVKNRLKKYLNEYAKVSLGCPMKKPKIEFKVLKERTVTPLVVYPHVRELRVDDRWAGEARRQQVYFKGRFEHGHTAGTLYGAVRKDPRTGKLTIVGGLFRPSKLRPEQFVLTTEVREKLKILERISLKKLVEVVGKFVCGIIGRDEAVEACLIAYHTPLYIPWKGKTERGWPHIALFGDTTTGKRIPREIARALGLGTYVIMETASRTGLLYTIQYLPGRTPVAVLGEFCLADKQLLIIDGYDRMNKEVKDEFREAFRQGILKVRRDVKISAPMRVRLITCENAPRPLSHYMYPCKALLDNYKPEHIARIDLAIPFAAEDVPTELFMRPWEEAPEDLPEIIEALRCNVLWAWSLKPEEVEFTPDALEYLFERARELERKFGCSSLPLVSKDVDLKIARLAAGLAALRRSVDDRTGHLIVRLEHVEHIVELMERIYSRENMRLDELAETSKKRSRLTDEEFEEIVREMKEVEEKAQLEIYPIILEELEVRGAARLDELVAATGEELGQETSRATVKRRMALLKAHKLVISTRRGYVLTPKGVAFMHRWKKMRRQQGQEEEKLKRTLADIISEFGKWAREVRSFTREAAVEKLAELSHRSRGEAERMFDILEREGKVFKLPGGDDYLWNTSSG